MKRHKMRAVYEIEISADSENDWEAKGLADQEITWAIGKIPSDRPDKNITKATIVSKRISLVHDNPKKKEA